MSGVDGRAEKNRKGKMGEDKKKGNKKKKRRTWWKILSYPIDRNFI